MSVLQGFQTLANCDATGLSCAYPQHSCRGFSFGTQYPCATKQAWTSLESKWTLACITATSWHIVLNLRRTKQALLRIVASQECNQMPALQDLSESVVRLDPSAGARFAALDGLGKFVLSNIRTPKVLMDLSPQAGGQVSAHGREPTSRRAGEVYVGGAVCTKAQHRQIKLQLH
eukprot:1155212-Pelagomonas_calceolata.AAC.6